ncbi:hemagglutination repeat-containing protein [Rutstroemia sp. NJR-2017a WRK4]|nr:hemagglutination repeat-containing protein [Rutstroemia sp. NJR-2017a WRK4]
MRFQLVFIASALALCSASPLGPTPIEARNNIQSAHNSFGKRCNCNCTGTTPGPLPSSAPYICQDDRLGPMDLPSYLPLSGVLSSYDRFGGLTPGDFLKAWTDSNGKYKYPPGNGFSLDAKGNPINGSMILTPGTLIDRFGSEYGSYVSSANAPYSQRSLPPSNLDFDPKSGFPYNYHVYRVLKDLPVVGGPIAPWFGQPGLGAQFYVGGLGNIMYLINNTYIERVDSDILVASKEEQGCGY